MVRDLSLFPLWLLIIPLHHHWECLLRCPGKMGILSSCTKGRVHSGKAKAQRAAQSRWDLLLQQWKSRSTRKFGKPSSEPQSKCFHGTFHAGCFLKKILLNLLRWHWLIKLYRFHLYNSIIHHLYIVLCVHHPNSSLLPSPFIPPLPSYTCSHPSSLWQSPYSI